MIKLFEDYINSEQIELGDFLILQYEVDNDVIYLVEVTSKGLRDEKSKYAIKYYIKLVPEDENDEDDVQILYYDIRKKQYFTQSFSLPIEYKVIYKSKNEFEAIDKYEDLLKIIENTNKYNL